MSIKDHDRQFFAALTLAEKCEEQFERYCASCDEVGEEPTEENFVAFQKWENAQQEESEREEERDDERREWYE
jgi:hypothetical protein